eukprot:265102-Alexandrium_andersonii.AAC.1
MLADHNLICPKGWLRLLTVMQLLQPLRPAVHYSEKAVLSGVHITEAVDDLATALGWLRARWLQLKAQPLVIYLLGIGK